MSSNHPKSGPNFAPAYQVSGIPFATGSVSFSEVPGPGTAADPINVKFPYVTKNILVRNTGAGNLRVAFSYSGSFAPGESHNGGVKEANQGKNYFVIPSGSKTQPVSSQTFDIRCKEIFLLADTAEATGYTLLAGLTTIDSSEFPFLTASNGFEGVG